MNVKRKFAGFEKYRPGISRFGFLPIFLGLLVSLFFAGCPQEDGNDDSGSGPVPVSFSLVGPADAADTNGVSASGFGADGPNVTTTALALVFDREIPGLDAGNITVAAHGEAASLAESGGEPGAEEGLGSLFDEIAVKGLYPADGSPGSYILELDSSLAELALATAGNLAGASGLISVGVSKDGYAVTPSSREATVFVVPPTPIVNFTAAADGEARTVTTTRLELAFSMENPALGVPALAASDIHISGDGNGNNAGITVTGLSGSGNAYTAEVSGVDTEGFVTVNPVKNGYIFRAGTLGTAVHYVEPVSLTGAAADGSPVETTRTLTLAFDREIPGLAPEDITVNGNGTGTKKKAGTPLAHTEGSLVYGLAVEGITTSGTVTVAAAKTGYAFTDAREVKGVAVSFAATAVMTVTPDGTADTVATTHLTLAFTPPVSGLAASHITLADTGGTGAKVTGFAGSSGSYTLTVGGVTKAGNVTVSVGLAGYSVAGVAVALHSSLVKADSTSLKTKFGIGGTGKTAVGDTFNALSAYIKAGGLSQGKIKTGDWIDLEGGLDVEAYADKGKFSATNAVIDKTPFTGYEGRKLRLIVVGIDSFNTINGNKTPHVVFQFQNIPAYRRIHSSEDAVGYGATEMRKYLTPVSGDNGSGMFYNGLVKAGIPENVLWAPIRYVSNRTAAEKITDLVWLPTEWEIFGARTFSYDHETSTNQVKLAYYSDGAHRTKYSFSETNSTVSTTLYRLATPKGNPVDKRRFCIVQADSAEGYNVQTDDGGFAPAFCVQ
jgi:hypothetical protein